MTKADRMLKEVGFEITDGPFDDWYTYSNKYTGVSITFMDDIEAVHSRYEVNYDLATLNAITTKARELGWGGKSEANDKSKALDRLSLLNHYANEAQVLGSDEAVKEAYMTLLKYIKDNQ